MTRTYPKGHYRTTNPYAIPCTCEGCARDARDVLALALTIARARGDYESTSADCLAARDQLGIPR